MWTCRYCAHGFTTWTRRGLRVTCPKCGRVQEGPAGIARIEELAGHNGKPKKKAAAVKIVTAKAAKPTPKPKAAAAVAPSPPAASPKEEHDWFTRLLYRP